MPRVIQLLFLMSVCLLTSIPAYALDFEDGEWELVVRQGVKGMPSGMGTLQWREGLTRSNPIPTMYLKARSCSVIEQHAVYHTLHYKMSCYTEHGTITNAGKIHYSDFKLNGDSKSDLGIVAGENMVVRYKFEGRRIGECH